MPLTLQNDCLELTFDDTTGALTGFLNRATGWQAIRQPRLAQGLELLLTREGVAPLPPRMESEQQRLTRVDKVSAREITLVWEAVRSRVFETLPIHVTQRIRLEGSQARFDVTVGNYSSETLVTDGWDRLMVEEVWGPVLGGLREPEGQPPLLSHTLHLCGGLVQAPLGDGFPAELGYWGTRWPTFLRVHPGPGCMAPFCLLTNGEEGLSLSVEDRDLDMVVFSHELRPGYAECKSARVPPGDEIAGHPAGFVVGIARMPFIRPRERKVLATAVIEPFQGGWREGLAIHRRWRETNAPKVTVPDWVKAREPWMTIQMAGPDKIWPNRLSFEKLPAFARAARDRGVRALQLIGWSLGGQDCREPQLYPNIELGRSGELKPALEACEEIGVKPILMCKFKWADRTDLKFEREWLPHAIRNMHGKTVEFEGYGYDVLSQHIPGGSRFTGVALCHLGKEFHRAMLKEFDRLLDLNPAGILIDELCNPFHLCFSEDHGHAPGACHIPGTRALIEEMLRRGRAKRPDFLIAGEGAPSGMWDLVPVNYIRTWDGHAAGEPEHLPAGRLLEPNLEFLACSTGFEDRELMGQCQRHGYTVIHEPFHFKGRPEDIPAPT